MLDDDEPPFVGPEIQNEYEACLGAFLVRFNRIENLLETVLQDILTHYGKSIRTAGFDYKITCLELLSLTDYGAPVAALPFNDLKSIAGHRNLLAHGHFEQNPFDGDYVIVKSGEEKTISIVDIKRFSQDADAAWDKLRGIQAALWFGEVVRE